MSQHPESTAGESIPVRINDRRRFTPEGEPKREAVETTEHLSDAEQLELELTKARARINDLALGLKHAEADREAFKARLTRERDQLLDLERGKVAGAVLEAVEELDRCLSSADADAPLTQGVRLIREELFRKVQGLGIEAVPLEGQPFDPETAEAADLELTADEALDGRVLAVFRPAWALGGRVIRPGRVRVARYVAPASA